MRLNTHLSFNGQCEAAFRFYERSLGAKIVTIMTYAGTPMEKHVPPEDRDKILHATLTVADTELMGADVLPGAMKSRRASRWRFISRTRPRGNAYFRPWPKTARCRCRSRRRSGRVVSVC